MLFGTSLGLINTPKQFTLKSNHRFNDDSPISTREVGHKRECNTACIMDAACVAYTLHAPQVEGEARNCTLHSKSGIEYPELIEEETGTVFADTFKAKVFIT